MSAFRVGQKVVCVDATWPQGSWYGTEVLPVENAIYTVRNLVVCSGVLCIRLEEIQNPVLDYQQGIVEGAFAAFRFRRVATQSDDVSLVKSLLTKVGEPA